MRWMREWLPYRIDGRTLQVAIADPGDVAAIDELRLAAAGFQLELGVASRIDILTAEQESYLASWDMGT